MSSCGKEQSRGINLDFMQKAWTFPDFRWYYKANENASVLAQKKAYGLMEQNGESKNKPTHLWSISLHKGGKDRPSEKVSSERGVGKVRELQAKQWR